MFSTPAGPPRRAPTPTRRLDLHVHPQRNGALDRRERWLVCLFLERYVVWLSRKRRIDSILNALGLLTDVAGTRVRARFCMQPDLHPKHVDLAVPLVEISNLVELARVAIGHPVRRLGKLGLVSARLRPVQYGRSSTLRRRSGRPEAVVGAHGSGHLDCGERYPSHASRLETARSPAIPVVSIGPQWASSLKKSSRAAMAVSGKSENTPSTPKR